MSTTFIEWQGQRSVDRHSCRQTWRHSVGDVEHDEIVRAYGPWRRRTPQDAADLLRNYPGRWWIAGGWAIEAFTNVPRTHGDIDTGIPRSEVPLLLDHLVGRLEVWAADGGTLAPLVGADATIPPTCGNLWLRPGRTDPWEYDVLLEAAPADQWTYKRDPRISLPLSDILWRSNEITYLRPEIQLLYKAPGLRAQDQRDFDACRPLLDAKASSWLRTALQTAHPGHAWLAQLA